MFQVRKHEPYRRDPNLWQKSVHRQLLMALASTHRVPEAPGGTGWHSTTPSSPGWHPCAPRGESTTPRTRSPHRRVENPPFWQRSRRAARAQPSRRGVGGALRTPRSGRRRWLGSCSQRRSGRSAQRRRRGRGGGRAARRGRNRWARAIPAQGRLSTVRLVQRQSGRRELWRRERRRTKVCRAMTGKGRCIQLSQLTAFREVGRPRQRCAQSKSRRRQSGSARRRGSRRRTSGRRSASGGVRSAAAPVAVRATGPRNSTPTARSSRGYWRRGAAAARPAAG